MIEYLDIKNLPGLLLNVDFEKAFDSLDWGFMAQVLKAFGFGPDICKWVEVFYSDIKSAVIVNGLVSSWFPVSRGCRQGDPISPYLFVLCVEILAIMVRENKDIQGIFINNVEHKIAQYADDTEFLLQGDRRSFETCINVLEAFGKKSGLVLNADKSSALWLGREKRSKKKYMQHLGIQWNPDKIKVLGIWITCSVEECTRLNYEDKFYETKKLFQIWSKRNITPLGRVAILKSLILSKLIHLWLLLPNPPDKFIKDLLKECFASGNLNMIE